MNSGKLVAIVEDELAIRENYSAALQRNGYRVQGYASRQAALSAFDTRLPDLVIIDINLGDEIEGGFELCRELRARSAHLPIIFLTGHGNVPSSFKALKRGAVDFFEKPIVDDRLLSAVKDAVRQNVRTRRDRANLSEIQQRVARLTRRELQVFRLVVQGKLNKQVAVELGMSEKTVKVHRARVMQKM